MSPKLAQACSSKSIPPRICRQVRARAIREKCAGGTILLRAAQVARKSLPGRATGASGWRTCSRGRNNRDDCGREAESLAANRRRELAEAKAYGLCESCSPPEHRDNPESWRESVLATQDLPIACEIPHNIRAYSSVFFE